jgi:tRNA-dependent cyclodipeptide synthase
MKLYKIRGGNKKDLYNRNYNIGIAISLGSKWFSVENIVRLIEWSLEYTKDFVVVYVADSIHAINIEVRSRKSSEKAKEIAIKMGDKILEGTKALAEKRFSHQQLTKIYYAKWDDITTPKYRKKVKFLYNKCENDPVFRCAIFKYIEDFLKKEDRVFSQKDKQKLGMYIIEEMPEILCRVPIKNLPVDAYIDPFDSELCEMVEQIQKGAIFPEIKEKIIDTEPKVFLEVRD